MKKVLQLTIDESLYTSVNDFASKHHVKVDDLVENYFKKILANAHKPNIVTLIDQLEPPELAPNNDLKELYYQNKSNLNGL